VLIPNPTAVFSLGNETEIMLTIGIIKDTKPTRPIATSIVKAVVVDLLKMNSNKPTMLTDAPVQESVSGLSWLQADQ
jgi:hypothetical protein